MGPVPKELYDLRDDKNISKLFSFQEDSGNKIIIPKEKPNLDYFNKREIDLMNQIIEIYAQGYVTSRIMSDASHQDILAWRRTWESNKNSIIDFALEFPDNILNRAEEKLTFPEEVFLVQKGIEHCT
jgi:hypothetical protein